MSANRRMGRGRIATCLRLLTASTLRSQPSILTPHRGRHFHTVERQNMKLNPESLYAATLTEAEIQRCRNQVEPAAYGTGLLVDANNVMYRMAFAVSKEVSTTAEMLAVFVDKVKCAAHEVGAEVVVCAIDHGVPLRRSMLGAKKKPDKTPEQEAVIELARGALHLLRDGLSAGAKYPYLNPFYMDGYEADDIVAAFAVSNLFAHAVIYSTDSDLYQVTNGSGVTQLSPSGRASKLWPETAATALRAFPVSGQRRRWISLPERKHLTLKKPKSPRCVTMCC